MHSARHHTYRTKRHTTPRQQSKARKERKHGKPHPPSAWASRHLEKTTGNATSRPYPLVRASLPLSHTAHHRLTAQNNIIMRNVPHRVAPDHQTHSSSSRYAPRYLHAAVTGVSPIEDVARSQVDPYDALCGVIALMKRPAARRTATAATLTEPTPRCPCHVHDEPLPDVAIPDEQTAPQLPWERQSCRSKSATDPNSSPQEGHSNHTRAPGGIRTRPPPSPLVHSAEGHMQRAPSCHASLPTCRTAPPLEEAAQGPKRTETCTYCEAGSSVRVRCSTAPHVEQNSSA